jgi:hypothetical protein
MDGLKRALKAECRGARQRLVVDVGWSHFRQQAAQKAADASALAAAKAALQNGGGNYCTGTIRQVEI